MYYKLKDGTIIKEPEYIMPDSWVDNKVAEMIRGKYSDDNREMYLVNAVKKASGKTVSQKKIDEFDEFDAHREKCIEWGKAQKALYAERKSLIAEEIEG